MNNSNNNNNNPAKAVGAVATNPKSDQSTPSVAGASKAVMTFVNSLPKHQQLQLAKEIHAAVDPGYTVSRALPGAVPNGRRPIVATMPKRIARPIEELKKEAKQLRSSVVKERGKDYGTPKNGVSHNLAKFTLNAQQSALLAWAHTVLNPRTMDPHPVPLGAIAGGASAAEAKMYKVTLYGTAVANATGNAFIIVNADGWQPWGRPQPNSIPGGQPLTDATEVDFFSRYLTLPGTPAFGVDTSGPVSYTLETWDGYAVGGYTSENFPPAGINSSRYWDGTEVQAPWLGLAAANFPENFCPTPVGTYPNAGPNPLADARYNNVAVELRLRPIGKVLDQEGDITIFNWRGTPPTDAMPTYGTPKTLGDMLSIPDSFLSRNRQAVAGWPSSKWLSAVANPNTSCCFSQPAIMPANPQSGSLSAPGSFGYNPRVGFGHIFAAARGLDPGTPIEFEVTYDYAIYGIPTYQTPYSGGNGSSVGAERVSNVVTNGLQVHSKPMMTTMSKESPAGLAAVVRAEQSSGGMPSGGGAIPAIVSGIKTAVPIVEAVAGASIGDIIADVAMGIGALLL